MREKIEILHNIRLVSAVNITGMSGSQYVNQWIRPHFWFVVYADPATCQSSPPLTNEVIEFEMEFLNPDSLGAATDHFGDDLRGQQNLQWNLSIRTLLN